MYLKITHSFRCEDFPFCDELILVQAQKYCQIAEGFFLFRWNFRALKN